MIDGANRNDITLFEPTLAAVAATGLLADIETLHLDRGYDYPVIRREAAAFGLHDLNIQRPSTKPPATTILITGRLIDWRNRWNPR